MQKAHPVGTVVHPDDAMISVGALVVVPLVEVPFPVVRHLPWRPRSRLAERVVLGRRERRTLAHLV
jgi:hypothetical protein